MFNFTKNVNLTLCSSGKLSTIPANNRKCNYTKGSHTQSGEWPRVFVLFRQVQGFYQSSKSILTVFLRGKNKVSLFNRHSSSIDTNFLNNFKIFLFLVLHRMNSPNHVSREQNNCLLRDSPSYNGFPRRGYEVFRSDFNGFPPNNSTVLPLNQHNGIVSDHLNEYPLNQQNGAVFNTFSDFPLNNNPNGIGPGRLNGFVLNDPNRIVSNSNFPSRDLDRFSERDQNELSPRQNEMYLPRFIVPDYQSTREDCVNCLSILHSPRPNELSAEDLATTSTQHECPHTRFTEYSVNFQPEDFELGYRLLTESTEPIEYQSDFMPQRISLPDIRPYEYDFQDRPSNHSQSEYLLNDPRIHRMRQLERTNASQVSLKLTLRMQFVLINMAQPML